MRVYICTDLEGVSGVTLWNQTREGDTPAYQSARRLLQADVNAAVAGCFDGGATAVTVRDGHGHPLNFVPEEMDPRAEYIVGSGYPSGSLGMDEDIDCGMLVGYHAMARTSDGVLCHTQSSRSDCRYWYNGRECGEMVQTALVMGHFGIPLVMLSGDAAACREAKEFFGEGIVTVAVKQGYARQCCKMLSPHRAHELIRAGAKEALGRIGACQPFTMELPIKGRLELLAETIPDTATQAEIEATPHKTYETEFETALDILKFR